MEQDDAKQAKEKELVAKSKQGDWKAFEALVQHCGIYKLCYKILGSHDDAEDAVQETTLRAWRGLSQFRHQSGFCTWLIAIARRICIDIIRRRNRRIDGNTVVLITELMNDDNEEWITNTMDPEPAVEDTTAAKDYGVYLQAKIKTKAEAKEKGRIKEKWDQWDWQVYILHKQQGMTYSEVERLTGMAEETLRSRMSTKVQPVLDEVGIEEKMQDKTEGKWEAADLTMFSARVARGKELRQTGFLFLKQETYDKERYRQRIMPLLEAIALGRRVESKAATQKKPEEKWSVADCFLFRYFVLEGVDYAEIVALSRKPETADVMELGQSSATQNATERCRERYHQRIKKIVIETIKELR